MNDSDAAAFGEQCPVTRSAKPGRHCRRQLRRRRNLNQVAEFHTNVGERRQQRVETRQIARRIWTEEPVPDDGADAANLDTPTAVTRLYRSGWTYDLTVWPAGMRWKACWRSTAL